MNTREMRIMEAWYRLGEFDHRLRDVEELFDREVIRLLSYPTRALVVESTWAAIESGGWRSQVTPQAALGSLLGWVAMGLPILMAENHKRAGQFVSRLLFTAARRRWRENRGLLLGRTATDDQTRTDEAAS